MRKLKLLSLAALLFLTKFSIAQTDPAITPYIKYLTSNTISAKEYVLNLFKTHDIVIICERMHPEFTQNEFLLDIVSDKRFINDVGNIFTEVGSSNLNPSLNTFLHSRNLPKAKQAEQILNFRRDLMWSAIWD